MREMIYLDNGTMTRPSQAAIDKMIPFYNDLWGSSLSPHDFGQKVVPSIKEAMKMIYRLVDAGSFTTFIFASSGVEAINRVFAAIYGDTTIKRGKNHFVSTSLEESSVLIAFDRLEQLDCTTTQVDANQDGQVTAQIISEAITPRTALVSMSWANGLTGVVNPVADIAKLCKKRDILFHLDVTHALGKLYFSWEDLGADLVTFNGDQVHAPQGTAGIFVREGLRLAPFIGKSVAGLRRRGEPINAPALAALGVAASEVIENRDFVGTEIARLRNFLEEELKACLPEIVRFFRDEERVPHCTAIAFPGVAAESLLYALNQKGLFATMGGDFFQPLSKVLQACGVDKTLAQCALNFSLSRYTTEEDIRRAVPIIVEEVKKLMLLSSAFVSETPAWTIREKGGL